LRWRTTHGLSFASAAHRGVGVAVRAPDLCDALAVAVGAVAPPPLAIRHVGRPQAPPPLVEANRGALGRLERAFERVELAVEALPRARQRRPVDGAEAPQDFDQLVVSELERRRGEKEHPLEAAEQRAGLPALLVVEERGQARGAVLGVVASSRMSSGERKSAWLSQTSQRSPIARFSACAGAAHFAVGMDRAVGRKAAEGNEERRDVELAQRINQRLANRVIAGVLVPAAERPAPAR
jgi:hypothetical protein